VPDRRWRLEVAAPARRHLDRLPEKVAVAVLEFLLGPFLDNPRRVGHPLHGRLAGLLAARVGAYRIVYRLDPRARLIRVVDIDHRADVYRRAAARPPPDQA
jgi:mRNA interferase RelE/StbE